ncbi:MAG: hypothetical protein HY869_24055 [Chloroflexi bacterium]|nr:hypothetical protein [Chloroflexota bacterium]
MNTNKKITLPAWINWMVRQLIPNIGTIVVVLSLLFVFEARAAGLNAVTSSSTISYQGTLFTAGGTAVNSSVGLTFRLYNIQSGGTALWTEAHIGANAVPVSNGLFNVSLGSITPIPSSVWTNSAVYLGVQVEGDSAELSPRELIGSVPFANHASNVPQILGSIMCDNCGNLTEGVSQSKWVTVKGATADDLIQVTATTTGSPLLITMNMTYSSPQSVDKYCAIAVLQDTQIIRFLNGDGSHALSDYFSCSSSYVLTDLPAGTYTFRAMAWTAASGGDITWIYQRQIAVIEY